MAQIIIKNATIINEGRSFRGDLLIRDETISALGSPGSLRIPPDARLIDATGLLLIPGVIDDQVHFREPGLTHKADIFSETRAAAAGGVCVAAAPAWELACAVGIALKRPIRSAGETKASKIRLLVFIITNSFPFYPLPASG